MFTSIIKALLDIIFPVSSEVRNIREVSLESLRKLISLRKIFGINVLFPYKNPLIRKMIWEMKARGDLMITKLLAVVLIEHIINTFTQQELTIIPIPASAERLRKYGFNQCEILAKQMLKIDCSTKLILKTNILFRRGFSNQQKKKSRKGRMDEITDTFIVKNISDLMGSNIILIDDVVTTGATLNEARRALMMAGACNITCFGLAH